MSHERSSQTPYIHVYLVYNFHNNLPVVFPFFVITFTSKKNTLCRNNAQHCLLLETLRIAQNNLGKYP